LRFFTVASTNNVAADMLQLGSLLQIAKVWLKTAWITIQVVQNCPVPASFTADVLVGVAVMDGAELAAGAELLFGAALPQADSATARDAATNGMASSASRLGTWVVRSMPLQTVARRRTDERTVQVVPGTRRRLCGYKSGAPKIISAHHHGRSSA
jgi:hypothetical protein